MVIVEEDMNLSANRTIPNLHLGFTQPRLQLQMNSQMFDVLGVMKWGIIKKDAQKW